MSKNIIVTGASTGIGYELALVAASHGYRCILVARSANKLQELSVRIATEYGIESVCVVADLSTDEGVDMLIKDVAMLECTIDILINNAGFGDYGLFIESDWKRQHQMIALNIEALTKLTWFFAKQMAKNGGGKIMNVASTAAFQPGPYMSVYYATKAFVLHFSEAVNNEVQQQGITVTALCPGPTHSDFQETSGMSSSRLVSNRRFPTSKQVALYGWGAMMKGKSVAIHGIFNHLLTLSLRFSPRNIVVRLLRFIQQPA